MVRFGKQLEAELVQEWGSAYVDYRQLKRDIEAVRQALADSTSAELFGSRTFARELTRSVTRVQESVVSATGRAADFLKSKSSSRIRRNEELLKVRRTDPTQEGKFEEYRTELSDAFDRVGAPCRVFFARLDGEFNKVNKFCRKKEKEFTAQYESLKEQVEALEEIRVILKQGDSYRRGEDAESEIEPGRHKSVSEALHLAAQRLVFHQAAHFMNGASVSPGT
ncbi:hypothetical protein R1sor_022520 [Riccia sorocarpa]|uniref:SPX domain-containing protein n=1 Tax=Riccia sorocarpa TaxID=122646 RepID=A0ABD3GQZ2_9MARC